jgi:hypothetical protein
MGTKAEKRSPIREKPLRLPGQGLDERLRDLVFEDGLGYILPAAFAWMVVVGSLAQSFINRPFAYWLFSGVAIALTIRMAYGIWRIGKHAHCLRLGRTGERTVGQILQTIDLPGTRVFHDIPSEHGNIDHVVVCDRGVYVMRSAEGNANFAWVQHFIHHFAPNGYAGFVQEAGMRRHHTFTAEAG